MGGVGWHGYDLSLIFFDQPIQWPVLVYNVWDSQDPTGELQQVIKLGFGRTGWGGDGSTQLDQIKRWGLAIYEDFGLGDYGVPAPAGGGWNNTHTQLTFDFDDGTYLEHNGFNFYEHFAGVLQAPARWEDPCRRGGTLGFIVDEVIGASGASGGPNFAYDEVHGEWRIIAVNSYVFRIPENWGGFVGTSDLTNNWDFSWGEFEADALVDDSLVDQVLGLELVAPSSPPFGLAKTGVNGGTLDKPGQ